MVFHLHLKAPQDRGAHDALRLIDRSSDKPVDWIPGKHENLRAVPSQVPEREHILLRRRQARCVDLQDPRVGTTLSGRYVIEEVLGEGGMATVYRARHKLVDRPCAVKIMNPGLSRDPVVRERFRREAKAAQKLAHPNIIEIFDQGDTDDGVSYIVMELLEGEALGTTLARGPLTLPARAPHHGRRLPARSRARTISRSSTAISSPTTSSSAPQRRTDLVKLLDFGIARSMQDARLTGQGEVFGTPQYMAPERITSIDAGASSDLYAIGIIFFEMLTGQLPFDAPDIPSFFLKHLKEPRSAGAQVRARDARVRSRSSILSLMAKIPGRASGRRAPYAQRPARHLQRARRAGPPRARRRRAELAQSRAGHASPVAIDRWAKRTSVFEQMLVPRLRGQAARRACAKCSSRSKSSCTRSAELRVRERRRAAQARGARVARSRRSSALRLRSGRARRRCLEGSRRGSRGAHRGGPLQPRSRPTAQDAVLTAHKEILMWEGRSAFEEPYKGLEEAYASAAEAVRAWLVVRKERAKGRRAGRDP